MQNSNIATVQNISLASDFEGKHECTIRGKHVISGAVIYSQNA
jgi:hypothetical protein